MIEAQAAFITEVQSICRQAKQSRNRALLQEAAAMLDDPRFAGLEPEAKINLQAAYRDAYGAATGAGAP